MPNADNTQCELCGDGYYKGANDVECVACPNDKPTTLTDGRSSKDDCYSKLRGRKLLLLVRKVSVISILSLIEDCSF